MTWGKLKNNIAKRMQTKIKMLKQCICLRKIQDMNTSKNLEEYKEKMTPDKRLELQNDLEGAR